MKRENQTLNLFFPDRVVLNTARLIHKIIIPSEQPILAISNQDQLPRTMSALHKITSAAKEMGFQFRPHLDKPRKHTSWYFSECSIVAFSQK